MSDIVLFDYWRSSASYRVRIALNLKELAYSIIPVNLLLSEHKSAEHLARQPQGIVPALNIDGSVLTQSLAIIEYLDEVYPQPELLPDGAVAKAQVRAMSYAIAMEIHPICNMSVVAHIMELSGGDDEDKVAWMQKFIRSGLEDFEVLLAKGIPGKYCHGDFVSMADCCLIPQLYNARRWGADYNELENICRIEEQCNQLAAFENATPENCKPK